MSRVLLLKSVSWHIIQLRNFSRLLGLSSGKVKSDGLGREPQSLHHKHLSLYFICSQHRELMGEGRDMIRTFEILVA